MRKKKDGTIVPKLEWNYERELWQCAVEEGAFDWAKTPEQLEEDARTKRRLEAMKEVARKKLKNILEQ